MFSLKSSTLCVNKQRYLFDHYTIEYASFSLERSRVTFVKGLDSALENRIPSARERRTRIFYYATMRKGALRYLWRFVQDRAVVKFIDRHSCVSREQP